ncbi:MAG: trypsin-like peptidase domain-containing protein [bacterium]
MEVKQKISYILIGVIAVGIPFSVSLYYSHKVQRDLSRYVGVIVNEKEKNAFIQNPEISPEILAQPKRHSWLNVQKKSKDTVVQVFTQITRINWLEPYKTPEQSESLGSAFFVNSNGHLITNYHVVAQASSVQIQLPSFGRERFDVEIVGVCPDKDVSVLKLTDKSLKKIKRKLGKISYLDLGDSDTVLRTQEVLALGYPLGQERLKSTLGIVSGRERSGLIQITTPLNPGSSGGPLLDINGKVVGINQSGILEAQNVGYIIPINEVKRAITKDLYKIKLLRKPTLGCIFTVATNDMVKYLNNPEPGGWYIAKVFDMGLLSKIGVKQGDMLYEINGYKLDIYGELSVPWSEDKVSLIDFLNRFGVGDKIHLVIYRSGIRKDFNFELTPSYIPPIRKVYSEFESQEIDYVVFGGMVLMPLTLNHIAILLERVPELVRYIRPEEQQKPAVVITHILPDSQARKARVLTPGATLEEVNGEKIKNLDDFRQAVKKSRESGFLTVSTDDKMFAVLSIANILKDEDMLASRYFYKKSDLLKDVE